MKRKNKIKSTVNDLDSYGISNITLYFCSLIISISVLSLCPL